VRNGKRADVRLGSKADIGLPPVDVRFTPKSGHRNSVAQCLLCAKSGHSALQQKLSLFDRLVGSGKQHLWNAEAERFSGLEIDDQLDLDGLLDRRSVGLSPLKPNCWVLLHQFARCRDGEVVLFGRH
jgi:hypothetical protein